MTQEVSRLHYLGRAAIAAAKRLGHSDVRLGFQFQCGNRFYQVKEVLGAHRFSIRDITDFMAEPPIEELMKPDHSHAKDSSIYADATKWADPGPAEWKPDTVTVTTDEPEPVPRVIGVYGSELVIPLCLIEKTEAMFPGTGQVGTMIVKTRVSAKALHQIRGAHDAFVKKNGFPRREEEVITGQEYSELREIRAILAATGHASSGPRQLHRLVDDAIERERIRREDDKIGHEREVDGLREDLKKAEAEAERYRAMFVGVRVAFEDAGGTLKDGVPLQDRIKDHIGHLQAENKRISGLANHYADSMKSWMKRAKNLEARLDRIMAAVKAEHDGAEIIPF